jgi:ketosteroid isomerase-like protein
MKNLKPVFCLAILVLINISVFGQPNRMNHLKNKIEKINSEVSKALVDKKFQSIMGYYNNDAISMPEYQASLITKEKIETYYNLLTKRFNINAYKKEIIEIIDLDSRIIEIGNFTTTYSLIEKDTSLNLNGSYLNVWERTKNGKLKVLVESWNYRHDVKNRELFTFSELGKSSWNDSYLKIDTTSIAFELAGLNELMTKTVSSHNPQLWTQFFTTDAKYIYSHTPVQEGINAINQHLIEHCKYLPKFDKLLIGNNRIEILNGYIIEYASHYVDWSFGETKGISTGKDIRIWKRMPDCSLKIYRQIAMYDN